MGGAERVKAMAETGMRQRATGNFEDYEADTDSDLKGHPPPAKQVGMGMLIGMGLAALMIIVFVVYIEEEKWKPDHEMHAKVVEQHKKHKESHAILSKILKDTHEKHARGELPVHEPTEEQKENERVHKALRELDDEHDHHPDAPGMIDALGNQMQDSPHDLKSRLKEFWRLDKNKDAFLTEDIDFYHAVRRPSNLDHESFVALDKNKDGAIGIREFCAGFHDQAHIKEPWYHHKYGYVYGHDIPDHVSKARPGAVKKGTEEHKAAKAGVHPAQTQKKLDKKKRDVEMKELNQKAHEAQEAEHERQEKSPHYAGHDDEEPSARL